MDFVLIPEAWMDAWVWEPVTVGLRALSVLEEGDMREAIVVGHSYSGIVAGQVADRTPVCVAHRVCGRVPPARR